jgi:hypothetical protein
LCSHPSGSPGVDIARAARQPHIPLMKGGIEMAKKTAKKATKKAAKKR